MGVDEFISRAKQEVLANLLNPQFGVSSLARKLGVSRSELYRRIKVSERKSASQFIREIRLERSLELLKEGSHSITEIAYMVGFNSPTYFSTCFKEYFGYSPSTSHKNGNSSPGNSTSTDKSRKWRTPIVIGVAAILITFFSIYAMNGRNDRPQHASLAVLKFDYLGTDSADVYSALRLADAVLNALSNHSELDVVAASSSFQADKSESCSKLGKKLGVDYLVDGSFSDGEDRLRATVKLIDAKSGHQLWARSFESNSEDLTTLQHDVSNVVSNKLVSLIVPSGHHRLTESKGTNLEAIERYLRAQKLGDQRYKDSITQAIRILEEALELDPNYAEAYGELSYLYGQLHFYGSLSEEDRDKVMDQYLRKALEIKPESPEVRFAKADFLFKTGSFARDSSAILAGLKEVHQEDPENARYCYRLFQVFRSMGQYEASHSYLEKAVDLEPANSFYRTILARDLFWKRDQKERAFAIIEEVTSKDRYHHSSVCFKTAMLVDQPQYGYLPAMKEIQNALEEEPYSDWYLYWGYQLALDLDLIPLASKYNNLYSVKFPENPIYTYGTMIRLLIAEQRFADAIDLTNIWINDRRIAPKIAAANMARLYYLSGDYQRSREILKSDFSDLLYKIEKGELSTGAIQPGDLEPIRTYFEVIRSTGDTTRAAVYAEFLCSYYSQHADAVNFGNKFYPLDCLYLKGDLSGFLLALEDAFFVKGERFRVYTQIKTLRYREFEKYPEFQELAARIEAEIHRRRTEVITYLKESGDWDPSWDAAVK